MTTLTLTVRGLNGSVIPNTSFKITAGYPNETYDPEIVMTSVVTFTTDNNGEATVTLTPGIAPYFLTRAAGMVDDVIAYKFYVPIGSTSLTLGLVYVDLKTQFKLLNDKSLYSLIEAKVAMLTCLEQAKVSAAAANESKETTADYLTTVEAVAAASAASAAASLLSEQAASTSAGESASSAAASAASAIEAEGYKDEAELARDAAIIGAGVYVDEPTGRAAVADGVAFKVQGSGEIAAYEYRRVNASSSTLIATYPSKAAYDKVYQAFPYAKGYSLSKQFPNLHDDPAFEFAEFNWPETGDYEIVTYNNRACIHFLPNVSGYSRLYAPLKLGSNKLSVSLRVEAKSAGTDADGRILLLQYSSESPNPANELSRQTYNFAQAAITSPMSVVFENIDVAPGAVSIYVFYETFSGNDFYVSEFVVAGGDSSGFRQNIETLNLWPEPNYASASYSDAGSSSAYESNIPTLTISGAAVLTNYVTANAVGAFAPGNQVAFGCELFGAVADSAQIEAVFFNDAGSEISRVSKDNDTTLSAWKLIAIAFVVPTNTRTIQFRHVLRYQVGTGGTQTAKFRKTFVFAKSKVIDDRFGGYFDAKLETIKAIANSHVDYINKLRDSRTGEFSVPNIYPDPFFNNSLGGTYSVEVIKGKRTLKVPSGFANVNRIPRSMIEGNVFSAGFTVAKTTANEGRVLIMQLDKNGAQLGGSEPNRLTYNVSSVISESDPQYIVFSNIAISDNCEFFEFYYDSEGLTEIWISEPWLRAGNVDFFVPPMPKVPNYWPDPYWQGHKMGTVSGDQGGEVEYTDGLGLQPSLKCVISTTDIVRRYYTEAVGILQPRSKPWLIAKIRGDVANCAEIGILYFDASGTEISRQIYKNAKTDLLRWELVKVRLSVPDNCVSVQFRFVGWNNGGTHAYFKEVMLTEYPVNAPWQIFNLAEETSLISNQSSSNSTIWVSSTGLDTNPGTSTLPVKTFVKAATLLNGVGRVIFKAGDYDSSSIINMSSFQNIEVYAEKLGAVRFILGLKITGPFTLVSGKTKVWEATWTTAPNKYIFEHNTPEGLIAYNERSPFHRGRTHRLPSHRLKNAASIDAIESSSSPSWFYDAVASKIYISTVNGDDPNTHEYYVPQNSAVTGGAAGKRIKVVGIHSWYGNFNFSNFDYYEASDLFGMGTDVPGCIVRDQSRGIEYRNEACAGDNDGTNMHNPFLPAPVTPGAVVPPASTIVAFDNYCHDNYDDGDSCHERCEGQYVGGLMEYNGDRGIATSYGAHVTAIGITTRNNGQGYIGVTTRSAGEGFGVVGDIANTEGGTGTEMHCINCTSIGDKVGFGALSSNCKLIADNCRTKDCETAYNAEHSTSLLILRDCRDSGSAVLKGAGSGTITIDNGTLVV